MSRGDNLTFGGNMSGTDTKDSKKGGTGGNAARKPKRK